MYINSNNIVVFDMRTHYYGSEVSCLSDENCVHLIHNIEKIVSASVNM